MTILIVCDFREDFRNEVNQETIFNDHPPKESVFSIIKTINALGIQCEYFGGINKLLESCLNNESFFDDTIFMNFSDGLIQNYRRLQAPVLLDLLGVKYSGSSPFVSALMNNKYYSKIAVEKIGISVPDGFIINKTTNIEQVCNKICDFPVIIKPNNEGSSVGIFQKNVIFSKIDLINKIKIFQKNYSEILIEKMIPGVDVTTFVIGNSDKILLNQSIAYKTNGTFYQEELIRDADIKSSKLSTRHFLSEAFPNNTEIRNQIKAISKQIFLHLDCRDIARIDFRITKDNTPVFIEINAVPSITEYTEAGKICEELGIPFSKFLQYYINTTAKRYNLL